MEARLSSPTDIVGFRTEARQLLAHQVPPEDVTWTADAGEVSTPSRASEENRPRSMARAASSIVPASFVRLCEYVVQHRDPDRFALLYRVLWRLVHEPGLRHDPADPDMARAQHMAHAVRRDIHKLKANLRFRELHDPAHPGESIHLAWCEPAHHIMETVAPWLAKRYPAMRWSLMTPERSVYWDGQVLRYGGSGGAALSSTAPESDWIGRWQNLFDRAHAA